MSAPSLHRESTDSLIVCESDQTAHVMCMCMRERGVGRDPREVATLLLLCSVGSECRG